MVKGRNFFPTIDDVAGFAFFAEVAFMGLAVGVAGKACVRRFAEFFSSHMALFACDCFVATLQCEFGFGMVEDDGLELDQLVI